MIKLKKFQPELVVLAFPEQHDELKNNPNKINKGLCMRWAYMCHHMFQGVQLWSMPAHAFVRYHGLFYDAERLKGTRDWRDLPACNFGQGCNCICCKTQAAKRHTPDEFKKRWNTNCIQPNWKWYRELAQSFVEKEVNHESID
jgi:hypothetical protein